MNIYTGLLFLHGHFTRPEDLEGPAAVEPAAPDAAATNATEATPVLGLADTLLLLGGRPMQAGHNADVEDPFAFTATRQVVRGRTTLAPDATCGA